MNNIKQFKSVRVGNSMLLIFGCIIIAFSVAHFYFKNTHSSKIENIIGHILLFPVYIVEGIISVFGYDSNIRNPVFIFLILLIAYFILVFGITKIISHKQS